MNISHLLTEIAILACGGIIAIAVAYTIVKNDLKQYFKLAKPDERSQIKLQLLPLRLQAHERLVVFIERINPANLLLRLHEPGISLAGLQSAILNEIRSEYQHNIAQQLYISSATWDVVSKLKDDTLAMINNAVRTLPEDAQGVDLSRKVLQYMANMEKNPYDLTLSVIKKDIHQFTTTSGIEIKEVYSEANRLTESEAPGVYPFTRGIQQDMYRGRLWTMRQYAGFSTAEESNKRYHYLLNQGTTGLSVAFDLPTQIGYDSDHDMAEGEVGKVGVAIDSLKDMEILFDGIELQKITTSMTINATASILLAMYIALARKQGADIRQISGTIQNDILKEYAARGTYIYPPKTSMRIITDIFEYCSNEVPKWNTISISGYHIREAGSTAVQELAFTLANGKAYLNAALEKGLNINIFAKRLSFFFNCHNNFFEEIAKFRAARRMWAKITKQMGATDPKAQMLRFHTQTGGST